jgi:alginate O-acetyltransferase complex protein AlgI
MGVMAYAMQLYFDFYGYSLMATGLGLCFGFEFPDNFDKPYHAISVQSFWNRWHVSLGQWIRLYVFLPLATRWRKKPFGISAAIFLTLVLIGLWHGPKVNYLWMGAWFGAWMVLEQRFPLPERWRHRIGWPLTAFAVLFGWVLLRASDMSEAWRVLRALASFSSFSFADASVAAPSPLALCLCATGLAYVLIVEKALDLRKVADATSWTKAIAGAALAALSLLLAYSEPTIPFLYFAF